MKKTKKPTKTTVKTATKTATATTQKKKKEENRRKHPRIETKNLWARERIGDFEFVSPVINISLGGILLDRRYKTTSEPSSLQLTSNTMSVSLVAQPLEERSLKKSTVTAYCFMHQNSSSEVALKNLIKELR